MIRWKSIIKFITEELILLFMIFINFQVHCENLRVAKTCGELIDSPGWTFPVGDIKVLYGNSLEIYCNLNLNHRYAIGRNASHISFRRGENPISEEYVTVLNETTARMFIKKPQLATNIYYCYLNATMNSIAIDPRSSSLEILDPCKEKDNSMCENETFVCMNSVYVGVPPQPVENFTCISYEWERLVCTWKTPNNYVLTKYNVFYKTRPGNISGRLRCPTDDDVKESRCEWSSETIPAYRKTFRQLYFEIVGTNDFGERNMKITFENYANVIPPEPKKFSVVEKTISSVYVNFSIGSTMATFEGKLTFKITYNWLSPPKWITIPHRNLKVETSVFKNDAVYINITDLPYPNVRYDIRVYAKSAMAPEESNLWSNFSSLNVTTNPCAPFLAPMTDIGSFEIFQEFTDYSKVNLYWQQIPTLNSNGDGLKYSVSKVYVDGVEKNVNAIENNHQSYMVYNISNFHTYRFLIISENNMGPSKNYSEITIPSISLRVQEVSEFTKLRIERGIYELSWKISEKHSNVVNFTIFWCESNLERPIQCDGFLSWLHVPANVTSCNVTTSNPNNGYQFAISANTDRYSSGMKWAPCTVRRDEVNKIKNLWINKADSHTIEIGWKLDCSDLVEGIKGYRVFYCPVVLLTSTSPCKEDEKYVDILGDAYKIHGTVENLKPYTVYKLSVAIFTFDGTLGPRSDYLFNHTSEAAPTLTNCRVKVTNISNTTISLAWDKPISVNGVLNFYRVKYSNDQITLDTVVNYTNATLQKLRSYTSYNISVLACTSKGCTKYNDTLYVTTKIGIPTSVERPAVNKNKSYASVVWKPLSLKSGPNIRYDVWFYEEPSSNNKSYMERNITENRVDVVIPECQEESNVHFIFRVRAKSYNEDYSEFYNGPWSDNASYNCGVQSVSLVLQITMYLILIIFIFISTVWGKKFLYKCIKMKNVVVTMPPTFAVPQLLHQGNEQELTQTWSKHNPEIVRLDAQSETQDEQLLLKSKQKKNNFEDEQLLYSEQCSSGCYSGENSAASSVNGANQSSDSGAEMDSKLTGSSYREEGSLNSHSRYSSFGSDDVPPEQWTDKPYVTILRNDDNDASVTWSDTYTICSNNYQCTTPPAISSTYVPLGIIASNLPTEKMDTGENENNYISWPISNSCCDISYDEILNDLPIGYSRATPWTSDEAIDKKKSSSSSCLRSDYVTLPADMRAISNNTNYI